MTTLLSKLKLAPVRWDLGQILLPEHFHALYSSLTAEMSLRASMAGAPFYGVAELSWDDQSLLHGQVKINTLTLVLPSGTLLHVPGNGLLSSLSLTEIGTSSVSVYLHLLGPKLSEIGNPLYAGEPRTLHRELYSLTLSTQPSLDATVESLKLAEFEALPQRSRWGLSRSYIPPLLQIGPVPFLRAQCQELSIRLGSFHAQCQAQLKDRFLRADRLASLRSSVLEVRQLSSLLAEIRSGVHPHPYSLFVALRRLYFHLCLLSPKDAHAQELPYLHDDQGSSFQRLFQELDLLLSPDSAQPSHVEMQRGRDRFSVVSLPSALSQSSEVFLLVSRNRQGERVSLDAVKLASPRRLDLVHRAALSGVPFRYDASPPPHQFVEGMDFYRMSLGEEWRHVCEAGSLEFYITEPLRDPDVKVLLCWKLE